MLGVYNKMSNKQEIIPSMIRYAILLSALTATVTAFGTYFSGIDVQQCLLNPPLVLAQLLREWVIVFFSSLGIDLGIGVGHYKLKSGSGRRVRMRTISMSEYLGRVHYDDQGIYKVLC